MNTSYIGNIIIACSKELVMSSKSLYEKKVFIFIYVHENIVKKSIFEERFWPKGVAIFVSADQKKCIRQRDNKCSF